MKDRYLFKAKRLDNREWETGNLAIYPDGKYMIANVCENPPDSGSMWIKCLITHEIDASTICQCTGLKDKNGKLIWENDFIERSDIHDIKEPSIGIIEYDVENTSFLIHWLDIAKYSPTFPWKNRIEVAGNKFGNPGRE